MTVNCDDSVSIAFQMFHHVELIPLKICLPLKLKVLTVHARKIYMHMAIKNHFHKQYLMINIYQNVDKMHFAIHMTPLDMKLLEKNYNETRNMCKLIA